MAPSILLVKPEGQLGNRLFQAATFLATSRELGIPVLNPTLGEHAQHFPRLAGDFFCRPSESAPSVSPPRRELFCRIATRFFPSLPRPLARLLGIDVLDIRATHDVSETDYDLSGDDFRQRLRRSRLVVPIGWKFRNHAALARQADDLRALFQPSEAISARVKSALAPLRSTCTRCVGVHVRRGDYAGWLGGRYFFEFASYARWMRQVAALWSEETVGFVVCTNEPHPDLLRQPGLRAVGGPGSAIADLYALAACDAIIGPPSTFSLWASFVSQSPLHMLLSADQDIHPATFTHHPFV